MRPFDPGLLNSRPMDWTGLSPAMRPRPHRHGIPRVGGPPSWPPGRLPLASHGKSQVRGADWGQSCLQSDCLTQPPGGAAVGVPWRWSDAPQECMRCIRCRARNCLSWPSRGPEAMPARRGNHGQRRLPYEMNSRPCALIEGRPTPSGRIGAVRRLAHPPLALTCNDGPLMGSVERGNGVRSLPPTAATPWRSRRPRLARGGAVRPEAVNSHARASVLAPSRRCATGRLRLHRGPGYPKRQN
jgi:hypothetical protein